MNGGNPAVPGNDEISPGVSWRLARPALYPSDPPAIAHFLGSRDWLISKVRVSSPDRSRDAIDLVAATVDAPAGFVEHAIFGEDLVDGRASVRRVVFTENVVKRFRDSKVEMLYDMVCLLSPSVTRLHQDVSCSIGK